MLERMNNTQMLKSTVKRTNPETLKAIQNVVAKINDLVQHIDEPEYLVDLMPPELIETYGTEELESAVRMVYRHSASDELSEKFTNLCHRLAARYFGCIGAEFFSQVKVRIRYRIDRQASTNMCRGDRDETVLEIPASSEAVMVERLIEEMLRWAVGRSCFECYVGESNRLYEEGAPMTVHSDTRKLSADEFIASYRQRPRELE